MSRDDHAAAAVAHQFLERYGADLAAGSTLTLHEYQRLWPGHEHVVEHEFRLLAGASDGGTDEAFAAGSRIDHYRLEAEIGRGAQGLVYRAVDEELGRTVALKLLRRAPVDDPRAVLRFQREARAASRLDHPGICAVYDSGVARGCPYIVMRHVEGTTLAATLAARSAPPAAAEIEEVIRTFEKAALALAVAHEAGVQHRDLKPANIMVDAAGEPVLLDFGLAGGAGLGGQTLTRTGDLFGTPAYLAPELLSHPPLPDAARPEAADIHALGVSLYEALTLERPYRATTLDGLYQQILAAEPRDPRERNPAVPRDLAVVVATAMDPAPTRRYASARALAEDLRRVRERRVILARPAPASLRLRRWGERNPVLATTLVALLVVITTALAVTGWLLQQSESRRVELQEALADARLGRLTRLEAEVEDNLQRGFQQAFSVDTHRAAGYFDRALELDPGCDTARVGRAFLQLPDAATAQGVLAAVAATGGADLRAFLEGHEEVGFFAPPVDPARAAAALVRFRAAVMLAPRPRFHLFHSCLMAAAHAGDRPAMEEAAAALEHHWPESQATWEAIAQFFYPVDPERGVAAMHRILALGESAAAHLGLAHHAQQLGDDEGALAHLDRAVAIAPHLAPAHLMRGLELVRMARHADAAASFVEACACGDTMVRQGVLELAGQLPAAVRASVLEACDER